MFTIKITKNLNEDIWNWWHACNKVSHGIDWKKKIDVKFHKNLVGKTEKEARVLLTPYLQEFYQKHNIDKQIKNLQRIFDQKKAEIFQTMEIVTKRPIYRQDFTCFITTFPRCPYRYPDGYIWLPYDGRDESQSLTFIHELLHFQFFAYYGEYVWDSVGADKYRDLKEAMTVIINDEFSHITTVPDKGYDKHKELRKKLLIEWRKHHDMDVFIKSAVELIRH